MTKSTRYARSVRSGLRKNASMDDASSVQSLSVDSSVHSSDYSASSMDDESVNLEEDPVVRDVRMSLESRAAASWSEPPSPAGNSSSSGGASPWLDGTDSSSGMSSRVSSQYSTGTGESKFERARSRLMAQYERQRPPPPKREPLPRHRSEPRPRQVAHAESRRRQHEPPEYRPRKERSESPSSVHTGQDPSKPIDVTGNERIPGVTPSILERVRSSRLEKQAKQKRNAARNMNPLSARIVGLVPKKTPRPHSLSPLRPSRITRHEAHVEHQHKVPRVIPVVSAPRGDGDQSISTIGGLFPAYKTLVATTHNGNRHPMFCRGDLVESGVANHSSSSKTRTVKRGDDLSGEVRGGCLSQRTDLELFLICIIVGALLTLTILLTLVLVKGAA